MTSFWDALGTVDLGGDGMPKDLFNSGRSASVTFRPKIDDKSSRSVFTEAMSCCPCDMSLGDSVDFCVVVVVEVVVFIGFADEGIPKDLVNSGRSSRVTLRPSKVDNSSRSVFTEAISCCPCRRLFVGSLVVVRGACVVLEVVVVGLTVVLGRSGINLANCRCENGSKEISQCQFR